MKSQKRWWQLAAGLVAAVTIVGLVPINGPAFGSEPGDEVSVLIDNTSFPYRSEFLDFDVREFISQTSPSLAQYRGPMFTYQEDVAEMVYLVAHYYGINPKVLLTMMEIQSHLISAPPINRLEDRILGYYSREEERQCEDGAGLLPGNGETLFSQIILLARRLDEGDLTWRSAQAGYPASLTLHFADNAEQPLTFSTNAATFAILYALAEANTPSQWQELKDQFVTTYNQLFQEDPQQTGRIHVLEAAPYPNTIRFPWEAGKTWLYSNKPHDTNSSALDFAPPNGPGCSESRSVNNWLVAADYGDIIYTSHLFTKIDLRNGWMIGYFHIPDRDKKTSGSVDRGQAIGHPGCCGNDGFTRCFCDECGSSPSDDPIGECYTGDKYDKCKDWKNDENGCNWCIDNWGCCSTGTHVHFLLYKSGQKESWYGKTISGGTIQSDGCLHKDGQDPQCPGSWITSNNDSSGPDNVPPNPPSLKGPADGSWINSRTVTLSWRDGGDPDNGPNNYRDYAVEVWKSGWKQESGWILPTNWTVTVPGDGTYSWRVKAGDGAEGSDWSETRTFRVDTTLPTKPTNLAHTGSGWYGDFTKNQKPSFTWGASTDGLSGFKGYYVAIDDKTPDGGGTNDQWRGTSTSWTVPGKLGEGPRTLYVRAVDVAGNANTASYRFTVDTSAPRLPSTINPGCDVSGGLLCAVNNNNCWQNSCNDPAFTWRGATDDVKKNFTGSGIAGYRYYWGTSEKGTPATWTTDASFDPDPIAPADGCAAYFMNMSVRDNLGHESKAGPAYVLRYDGAPPTATLQINGGDHSTNQVSVLLDVSAADTCAGIYQMRFSNNGLDWSDWQPFRSQAAWTVPALNQRWVTVYAQVRDKAGNVAPAAQDSIYLDLYPPRPSSASFLLCADVVDAAGSTLTSTSYSLVSAVGQPWAGNGLSSSGFGASDGFLGAYPGCPITNTFTSNYTVTQHVVASGGNLRDSGSYRLGDTVGEPLVSVPATRTLSSPSFRLLSGFWATISGSVPLEAPAPTPVPVTPVPTPTPGPTPTPQPPAFGVTAGELGTGFTNQTTTTLNLYAPNVSQVQISNEPAFISATWQSYAVSTTWPYEPPSDVITGSRIYVRYRDDANTVYGDYAEVIFYDGVPPSGWASLVSITGTVATLELDAWDDNSGLHDVRLATEPTFSGTTWLPYTTTVTTTLDSGRTVYVQFRDQAANVSEPINVQVDYRIYLPLVLRNSE